LNQKRAKMCGIKSSIFWTPYQKSNFYKNHSRSPFCDLNRILQAGGFSSPTSQNSVDFGADLLWDLWV